MLILFMIAVMLVLLVYSLKRLTSIAMKPSRKDWKPDAAAEASIDKFKAVEDALTAKGGNRSWDDDKKLKICKQEIERLSTQPPTKKDDYFNMPVLWKASAGISSFLALVFILQTSLVDVKENTTAHFERIWGGTPLKSGEIISRRSMGLFGAGKGPQSETVRPGIHFMLLQNVLYKRADEAMERMLIVPAGKFAILVAKDGVPMTGERMLAPEWDSTNFNSMLEDAGYFLNDGKGMKGMQYTVVPTGKYHINNYLWQVAEHVDEVKVGTGEVAVIRSNIQLDPNQDCTPEDTTTSVPLVPKNCRGVWNKEEDQGTYRFNPRAVTPTVISVRQNTNEHQGNYTRQLISFTTDKEGNIVPKLEAQSVDQGDAVDDAIDIRAEGWNIDQDVTVFWQVVDAPKAVAQLGSQEKIAQFISRVTQSEFRIIAQGKDSSLCNLPNKADKNVTEKEKSDYVSCLTDARQAMDLVYKRAEIEAASRSAIHEEIKSYGLKITKVTMGRPNIPPELLMPALRTQYAEKMQDTLETEEQTALKRIAVANANELANNQQILVKADLEDQAATKQAAQIIKLADARKSAAFAEAEGQKELLNVMGADKVQEQILTQKVLDLIKECPECVKVPEVLVQGGSGTGLEGFGAILGHSNVKAALASSKKETK